ncbi:MAG: heme ABC exporter ATP-binding protein CcmA [Brevundimonas sp.]|jgi:heme exporter protein A|uniref:heme ABC exporter ATP-binding protein CcmA n=1 Tax=Brevundimonas sp. TaxID=1871086 RepID=UPI00391DD56D
MLSSVTLDALTLSRGGRVLLRDLSLTLGAGEALALSGANGAGKTTLLRAIAGFIRPDAGAIGYRGTDGAALEPETARRHLHLLGHHEGLKGARTARDELRFQAEWLGEGGGIGAAADALGLGPVLGLETRRLSAGQRRRVSLARLVSAPRCLWLLDEPLAPLDARWRDVARALMARHLSEGGMIIAAVHDPLDLPARSLDLSQVSS